MDRRRRPWLWLGLRVLFGECFVEFIDERLQRLRWSSVSVTEFNESKTTGAVDVMSLIRCDCLLDNISLNFLPFKKPICSSSASILAVLSVSIFVLSFV
jgi:hypothetical protein